MTIQKRYLPFLLAWLVVLVAGCNNKASEARNLEPVAIEAGDECHVCGMIITRFPGPKGEAFVKHQDEPKMFCSTRDLFVWLLQPETEAVVEAIYVHDMEKPAWETPGAEHLIPAESAWFVIGSSRQGAMGATLVSFAKRDAAETFAGEYGGKVLAFNDITMETLNSMMGDGGMAMDHDGMQMDNDEMEMGNRAMKMDGGDMEHAGH
ncbi:MAG: nitrous oxide reductase accessory protein NosL [Pseudomonadota bacterium]